MISFERFTLNNGLKVIVHEDPSTPLACINILYDVGARDEHPDQTGFAHLFEHLMFGGSVNIPNYDTPLQEVGGENNAFTNNDITNYYLTLPAENIETGFWLESDRMLSLAFSEKSLEVQRNVVIEEFKQRYLNQPYGDEWLLLRPLAYKVHPYQWATIGKEISHIADAKMEDVRSFFNRFYNPSNAILVVAGNVKTTDVKALAEKWFEPIPSGSKPLRNLPVEPPQTEPRFSSVNRDVPSDAIHKVYHMVGRNDSRYYSQDLLSDVLGRGTSSRLYTALVKGAEMFTEINAYVGGNYDPGLFVVSGKIKEGFTCEQADEAIKSELSKVVQEGIPASELSKVKNKAESTHVFGEMGVLNKAMNLAFAELMGDAALVNTEIDKIRAVTAESVHDEARSLFRDENCSTLYYRKKRMMQPDRTLAPPAVAIEGVQYTPPAQLKLNNGLPVWYLNMGSQEVIKAEFVFHAGSAHHDNPLVPSFTSAMMQEGTSKNTAAEIADAIDAYGAFLELDHDKDFASITLYTLKRYYADTLPVILEIIEDANLPENEWKIMISNRIQKYRINLGKVSFVAGKAFQELVFNGTPYGAPFDEQTYLSVQLNDLLAFRGAHYRLEKSFVMLSGFIDNQVLDTTNQILGSQSIQTPTFLKSVETDFPIASQDRVHFIEKPDAIQSAIRIGRRMFDRRHPDYFGVKVLTTVLGGYFGSRLMSNIREDKGYTYGIGAGIVAYENDGWFYISTEVGTDVTSDALNEIYKEVALLRDELIPEDELSLVKNYMLGTLLKSFDGPFERIERFKALHLYHLGDDYYDRYTEAIRTVNAHQLRELARKWLAEADLLELVVGKK